MTYTEVPVTREMLRGVWSRLWPRGVEEFARNGIALRDGFDWFLHMAQRSVHSGILCADGSPVLVAGIIEALPGIAQTFMQATVDFESHVLPIMRVMRKGSKAYHGDLHIYSVCVHPEAARFFQALGYEQESWVGKTKAGHPLYRFKRK